MYLLNNHAALAACRKYICPPRQNNPLIMYIPQDQRNQRLVNSPFSWLFHRTGPRGSTDVPGLFFFPLAWGSYKDLTWLDTFGGKTQGRRRMWKVCKLFEYVGDWGRTFWGKNSGTVACCEGKEIDVDGTRKCSCSGIYWCIQFGKEPCVRTFLVGSAHISNLEREAKEIISIGSRTCWAIKIIPFPISLSSSGLL